MHGFFRAYFFYGGKFIVLARDIFIEFVVITIKITVFLARAQSRQIFKGEKARFTIAKSDEL